ncbi:biopolymer transporter ExbD [Pedobacter changchengzhani]|uniref:Biopolymer transporter ExbD n=1 Tax=Pedobacter changchengzhani TaxID=2529274 RepID=A0A4R5MN77_9SPHI|nr:biopolymer transporter ExbD [Pedobacter changchengzhani]TDG37261.1 biopolymer transporter ExbD [Pedobacter changchengzhani]
MAELNTGGKKATPRVDMTPMVDLMFLLVTFFILTTSLSTPQAMDIVKPDKEDKLPENRLELKASKTMTILLGKKDKVAWYMGEAGKSAPTIESVSQIDKAIIANRKTADASGVSGDFVVLVKPTSGSTFSNFVDIMDDLEILKVKVRQIDDENILDNEKQAMKEQGIL